MNLPLKIVLGSTLTCVLGAILLDCNIEATGWTLMTLEWGWV